MGGAASEVGDATTRVIVESAIFDPIVIRRTGQRYGLRSEASLRFEKGQEFRLARIGADRAARLVAEWAGGTVARGRIDTNPVEPEPGRVAFRPARVNRLLGTTFAPAEQQALLKRVGVASEPAPAATGAAVAGADVAGATPPNGRSPSPASRSRSASTPAGTRPSSRSSRPGGVTSRSRRTWPRRSRGSPATTTIPAILPHTPMPAWRPSPLAIRDRVRATLAGAGLTETVSHALVSPRLAETFRWTAEVAPVDGGEPALGRPIHVTNPLSADHSVLRPVLVGSLVEIVSHEPPSGPRGRRDLRDRQGLRPRRRDDPRVVAARPGDHRTLRGAIVEPAAPARRPRRREGRHRARLPGPRVRSADRGRRSRTSRSSIPAAPPA